MTPAPHRFIDSPKEFQEWISSLEGSACLAVDFEADGLFSYREKLCLVQVTERGRNTVIDPLALPETTTKLAPLLADTRLLKIFHGADYDVRLWKRATCSPILGLYDTMIAAQLCGRDQIGLAALLDEFFNIKLDKRYQKANWNKRPLGAGMLEYAALDTAHLLPLKQHLDRELSALGRKEWAEEEFRILESAEPGPQRRPSCHDVKGARRLSPRQLAVLQALLEVREAAAEEWDRPPFKVLNNTVLTMWAENPPQSRSELHSTAGVNRTTLSRLGNRLLDAVSRAQGLPPEACPRTPANEPYEPLTSSQEKRLKRLKRIRAQHAAALGISLGLLVNTATLERLARCSPETSQTAVEHSLKKWQFEVLGDALRDALDRS